MRHSKIKKLVSEYIDGELKNNVEFIEEHIKTCAECFKLIKVHELVRETLKEKNVEVSPYLFTRIQAKLKERKAQQTIWDYVFGFSKELAIALILIFIILIGIELMSGKTSIKIEEAVLNETPSVQKVISSGGNLSQDDVLELTLSNGGKK
ncbi:Putative zinc-finger [Candidatus Kryptobacter tengchongensis]|uniref:Zinc-finger n=1 Tax=Kryptobacter tengchongensis TaxID=1643429 RepID=A0A656DDZ9_KRYT1|nr:zf-HC2 domain-containing protein [Candidatus Kryptobacter tengchongensis]CUT02920.1 Putative zinc-finger [Candidatus Kryptobacter tengchongensis]CUT02940.1 Putative zinc-finger [Candidatus Kryptobacter tengchongensis]CUU01915.1 Putative zinc-finger [Candidatus Kryptobacter tengchongensis]CUU02862.1 Putative zinc-finger [Candidatus Kryptobacter tengchongensis]